MSYINFTRDVDPTNRDFDDFINNMREEYKRHSLEAVFTRSTPLSIESEYGQFKAGIYGDTICLNIKGELITLSIERDLKEACEFIKQMEIEIKTKSDYQRRSISV